MTRGRLPQRAGLPGLNGGGAAAVVPPFLGDKAVVWCTKKPPSWQVSRDIITTSCTYHDLGHCEEYWEQSGQGTVTVVNAAVTLQTSPVHSHVPVGQFVNKLHQSRHDGVQTIGWHTTNSFSYWTQVYEVNTQQANALSHYETHITASVVATSYDMSDEPCTLLTDCHQTQI